MVASTFAFAQANVSVNDQAALDFYKKSQLVISKSTVNPYELAGCLVLIKANESDQYLNVLPESIKKTLKPQNLSNKPYRTMLTKEMAVKAGFLGLLGITTNEQSLLEVSISDLWKLEGPSFFNDNELKRTVFEVAKIYIDQGYQVKYNQNVQYSHLLTSEFQESSGDVKAAFAYFDAGGKRYAQAVAASQREIISIAAFDITPLVKAWKPGSNIVVSEKDIQKLKSAVKASASALTLKPADTRELRQFSSRITSKDFKGRIER